MFACLCGGPSAVAVSEFDDLSRSAARLAALQAAVAALDGAGLQAGGGNDVKAGAALVSSVCDVLADGVGSSAPPARQPAAAGAHQTYDMLQLLLTATSWDPSLKANPAALLRSTSPSLTSRECIEELVKQLLAQGCLSDIIVQLAAPRSQANAALVARAYSPGSLLAEPSSSGTVVTVARAAERWPWAVKEGTGEGGGAGGRLTLYMTAGPQRHSPSSAPGSPGEEGPDTDPRITLLRTLRQAALVQLSTHTQVLSPAGEEAGGALTWYDSLLQGLVDGAVPALKAALGGGTSGGVPGAGSPHYLHHRASTRTGFSPADLRPDMAQSMWRALGCGSRQGPADQARRHGVGLLGIAALSYLFSRPDTRRRAQHILLRMHGSDTAVRRWLDLDRALMTAEQRQEKEQRQQGGDGAATPPPLTPATCAAYGSSTAYPVVSTLLACVSGLAVALGMITPEEAGAAREGGGRAGQGTVGKGANKASNTSIGHAAGGSVGSRSSTIGRNSNGATIGRAASGSGGGSIGSASATSTIGRAVMWTVGRGGGGIKGSAASFPSDPSQPWPWGVEEDRPALWDGVGEEVPLAMLLQGKGQDKAEDKKGAAQAEAAPAGASAATASSTVTPAPTPAAGNLLSPLFLHLSCLALFALDDRWRFGSALPGTPQYSGTPSKARVTEADIPRLVQQAVADVLAVLPSLAKAKVPGKDASVSVSATSGYYVSLPPEGAPTVTVTPEPVPAPAYSLEPTLTALRGMGMGKAGAALSDPAQWARWALRAEGEGQEGESTASTPHEAHVGLASDWEAQDAKPQVSSTTTSRAGLPPVRPTKGDGHHGKPHAAGAGHFSHTIGSWAPQQHARLSAAAFKATNREAGGEDGDGDGAGENKKTILPAAADADGTAPAPASGAAVVGAIDPALALRTMPTASLPRVRHSEEGGTSRILTPRQMRMLEACLPLSGQGRAWHRAFSLSRDGVQLTTLLSRVHTWQLDEACKSDFCLLAVKDEGGAVFGAFSASPWVLPKRGQPAAFFGLPIAWVWTAEHREAEDYTREELLQEDEDSRMRAQLARHARATSRAGGASREEGDAEAAAAAAVAHVVGPRRASLARPRPSPPATGPAPASSFHVYRRSGRNDLMQFLDCSREGTPRALGMGGGGAFALWLDERMENGRSGPCAAFLSPPLCSTAGPGAATTTAAGRSTTASSNSASTAGAAAANSAGATTSGPAGNTEDLARLGTDTSFRVIDVEAWVFVRPTSTVCVDV